MTEPTKYPTLEELEASQRPGPAMVALDALGTLITGLVILALCGGAIVIALGVLSWSWRQL